MSLALYAQELVIAVPKPTLFMLANLCAALLSLSVLALMVVGNPCRLIRPAFLVGVLTHLLYQWPLVLLSNYVEASMSLHWWFAATIHLFLWFLSAWIWFTKRLDPRFINGAGHNLSGFEAGIPLLLTVVFAAAYLAKVPWKCTALYALLADPNLTLLAREFSIKLVGASIATYSFGALANVTAPAAIASAFLLFWTGVRQKKFIGPIIWLVVSFASIVLVLLSGTKGLLVPSVLMLLTTSLMWNRRWSLRFASAFVSMVLLICSFVLFELVRERNVETGTRYDFAVCSAELGVCQQSLDLMESLSLRNESLGLQRSLVKQLDSRLACVCAPGQDVAQCKRIDVADGTVAINDVEPLVSPSQPSQPSQSMDTREKSLIMFKSVLYRALVVPFQVASWHYLYVEEVGRPGLEAMPLVRRFYGNSVNMPELVYQKYGSIYSGGDKTKTSTAPTGFMLAYSAYWGLPGLLLALMFTVSFDWLSATFVKRLRPSFLPLAAGFITILCLNFMVSDFTTVLGAHGGAVAVLLIFVYSRISNSRLEAKRLFDFLVSLILLLTLFIPMLVIAAFVRIKLGSPILFCQQRPGRNGKPFLMYKFRTMTDERDSSGNLLSDADRLTLFGKWLRSTSLDELPELFNVLKGDMSLVGPRPLLMEYLPLFNDNQRRRHEVRPGITGWAQINGRNALTWDERFKLDVWYVDNRSFWLDMKILFLTAKTVIARKGINLEGHATMEKFRGDRQ